MCNPFLRQQRLYVRGRSGRRADKHKDGRFSPRRLQHNRVIPIMEACFSSLLSDEA